MLLEGFIVASLGGKVEFCFNNPQGSSEEAIIDAANDLISRECIAADTFTHRTLRADYKIVASLSKIFIAFYPRQLDTVIPELLQEVIQVHASLDAAAFAQLLHEKQQSVISNVIENKYLLHNPYISLFQTKV